MLDLDHFKTINDRYGHTEGDRALQTITEILKQARHDKEWVFRFAGDEFVILKLTDDPQGLQPYMDEVMRLLDAYNQNNPPYTLSISYGRSFYERGEIDAFMRQMDADMYDMKSRHHAQACTGENK